MNLSVVDYLVKPVDKVELGNLLEKIAQQLQEKVEQSQTLSQELDETGFTNYLSGKDSWWIGLSKGKSRVLYHSLLCFWGKTGRFSSLINSSMASS